MLGMEKLASAKVYKGDLDGSSGLGKVIQRWDAKQAASGFLIFMPDLFHSCHRLSLIYRMNCALETMTQSS